MIMFGSFLPSLGWLAPPKFTRAWEPTLLWNHYTNNPVFGNSSVDGGLEFAEITALVPFSTPTPVCDSYLHPSARVVPFCSFGIASVRPDPDAIAKPTSRTASPLN